MNADELRSRYLRFFEQRGHSVYASDSLVPEGDASLLFTGAGMNQFKDAFLGKGPKDLKRATSSQKCLRMPDLDNVGRTPSHHTFFEMLGNFSFGDYFKREAIQWAWEFLTRELGLPREKLAVTVFLTDDEAATIWEKEIGVPKDRIFRYGEEDNFWPAEAPSKGPNGPCGPCSEIYFDFGAALSSPKPGTKSEPATDGKRFVEIWNLVFTQFDRRDVNVLEPLPRKNIDTGMGLERICRVMQGVPTNFETDLFRPMLTAVEGLTGRKYGADAATDVRMKRISDHVRAASFCIGDGVRPGNEGRGYVVRKVIRRAAMDLRELGLARPGLHEIVSVVARVMAKPYPTLSERLELIRDTVRLEEERFAEVYRTGTEKLKVYLDELDAVGTKSLSGEKAFFLWDTVGFPFDITKRYCEDKGYEVDEAGYERSMEQQRERARAGSQLSDEIFGTGPAAALKGRFEPTVFVGYDALETDARVVALLDGDHRLSTHPAREGDEFTLVLDRTPLYGEGGGQVGDAGRFHGTDFDVEILDTKKADGFHLHKARVVRGVVNDGVQGRVGVALARRSDVMRNHTGTHLLHWALRRVLGTETTQAGSLVHPDYLRFDYTASKAPTDEQLAQVEDLVNQQVLRDLAVAKTESSFDDAKAAGAMALFGEKYGDRVRVVKVVDAELGADFESTELCGGTHVARTGQVGVMKIVSDGAIAAGVRRIVAVTGLGTMKLLRDKARTVRAVAELLKAREDDVASRVEHVLAERSRLEKDLARTRRDAALGALDAIRQRAIDVNGSKLLVHTADGLGTEELRALADALIEPNAVVVLAGVLTDQVALVAACGDSVVKRGVKAGDLVRDLGKALGGGGGGKPTLAQGQGKDTGALQATLSTLVDTLRTKLGA